MTGLSLGASRLSRELTVKIERQQRSAPYFGCAACTVLVHWQLTGRSTENFGLPIRCRLRRSPVQAEPGNRRPSSNEPRPDGLIILNPATGWARIVMSRRNPILVLMRLNFLSVHG